MSEVSDTVTITRSDFLYLLEEAEGLDRWDHDGVPEMMERLYRASGTPVHIASADAIQKDRETSELARADAGIENI